MGTLSREGTLPVSHYPSFSVGISCQKQQELNPVGPNSLRADLVLEGLCFSVTLG